jgi:hypothetical protein
VLENLSRIIEVVESGAVPADAPVYAHVLYLEVSRLP